ncbi:hypothetical protein PIROE2DRAFT_8879 [Piromyces sp. E2]|nr:hypothetical protein PIROE2DRAFT_8879 [Piromyces sp. E2]|eukprot:OUM64328.1 hypothetical protein PIROE2DRAFT_8879 [Piromyces sp. E2]
MSNRIENSIFSNCTTDYGYLINITSNTLNDSIIIKNSTFINTCSLFQADSTQYKNHRFNLL